MDRIVVETTGWVKPWSELLLAVSFPLSKYVCVDRVWLTSRIP